MAALATVAELEARLGLPAGSLDGVRLARAQSCLNDASVAVRAKGRPSWTDATGANPAPEDAVTVTLWAALRMWHNPERLSYEQLGDYTKSRAGAGSVLTDEEVAMVEDAAGIPSGVYSTGTPGYWTEG